MTKTAGLLTTFALALATTAAAQAYDTGYETDGENVYVYPDEAYVEDNSNSNSNNNYNGNKNYNNSHSSSNAHSNSHSNANANASGGNAYSAGGNANANAHGGQGGNANAQGGQGGQGGSSSNSNNVNIEGNEAPTPVGIAPNVFIQPSGDCGEGWSLSAGFPYGSLGGGRSTQNEFCLSQKAAEAAINAGLVARDTGMVATGLATLRSLHPDFEYAATQVVSNLTKPCAAAAANVSAMMLTEPNLECRGTQVRQNQNFINNVDFRR